ncbi:MAG: methylated-DNA--[protein]-cysteine S-methyltransferase [Leptospirales bacterium]|nr:methylated-DNA--[protein]-cysteine S-methyltransferase [Leptospirales bacterium]
MQASQSADSAVRSARGPLQCSAIATPVGTIYLEADPQAIRRVSFMAAGVIEAEIVRPDEPSCYDHLSECARQLLEYFHGRRRRFDLPVDYEGTGFQRDVWESMRSIPFGETRTSNELAAALGRPRAVRAVGQANHVNRWMILVPCHRVVGQAGKPAGFAAGLPLQVRLLELEKKASLKAE